jgi:hypothetical protein
MTQALETQKALFKLRPTIVNVLSTVCLLSLSSMPMAFAALSLENEILTVDNVADIQVSYGSTHGDEPLTRGEAVQRVVDFFDLETHNQKFIESCFQVPDECFFVFSAMSDFDGITFDPLTLYPDVKIGNKYSEAINIATLLGLVHGYLSENQTPFHPNHYLTRIQALKVIFGATNQLSWKEKFEMDEDYWHAQSLDEKYRVGDVDPNSEDEWWYGRYVAFAIDAGLIEDQEYFRPNEAVTGAEMTEFMDRAKKFTDQPTVIDEQAIQETQQQTVTMEQTLN